MDGLMLLNKLLLVILTAAIELAPVMCLLIRSLGMGMRAVTISHWRFLLPALHARGESLVA